MIGSLDEFVRLRTSDDPQEYRRAAHDSATDDVWRSVIDARPDMRVWVARNKTISGDIIEVLSKDADPAVREAIAMKSSARVEVLSALAGDPDEGVRHAVVMNRKTPTSILERLAVDPALDVSEAARVRLTRFEE